MEDLFNNMMFEVSDFNTKWSREYKVQFTDELENDDFLRDKAEHLLNSLKIMICRLSVVADPQGENFLNMERYYLEVFKLVSLELNQIDISYDNIGQYIELFYLLVTKHHETTYFKILALCHLFSLLNERNFFEYVSDKQCGELLTLMQIKINTDDYCYYDIKNEWRYTIEEFLGKFQEASLKKNIISIQNFYE